MTITISTTALYFFYYWAFAIVYESIHAIVAYRGLKKKMADNPILLQVKSFLNVSSGLMALKKIVFGPVGMIGAFAIIVIASPLTFIFSFISLFLKLLKLKTKLEKRVAEEERLFNEAQKRSEEFMKNEGERFGEPFDFNFGSKDSSPIISEEIELSLDDIPDMRSTKTEDHSADDHPMKVYEKFMSIYQEAKPMCSEIKSQNPGVDWSAMRETMMQKIEHRVKGIPMMIPRCVAIFEIASLMNTSDLEFVALIECITEADLAAMKSHIEKLALENKHNS